jgi:betaine-aldehyde dehydrogenase
LRRRNGVADGLDVTFHEPLGVAGVTPFGGVKQSGSGRELGVDAPLAFTETRNVFIAVKEAT